MVVESICVGREPVQISVIISTRNRPSDVERCLHSLRMVDYPRWEIQLVDQSDDDRTRTIADSFAHLLPHLRYRHIAKEGLSHARNLGTEISSGDIVAFLDDDCTVEGDWLKRIAHVFVRYPHAVLVFGSVYAAPHDMHECFIPVCKVTSEQILHGRRALPNSAGMGASMYLRRAAWRQVGPFDELLGAGTDYFSGGDDDDYRYRCLVSGHIVVKTPFIRVQHFGARPHATGSAAQLIKGYAYSAGALDMKLLRCGEIAAAMLFVVHGLYCLSRINVLNLITRHGPTNLDWILMYIRGLRDSFRLKVDSGHRLYIARTGRLQPAKPDELVAG